MESSYFLIALAAVGVMGFANQRGGTCTVAAIEELVSERRFGQFIALFEASLWVAGGFVLLAALGQLPTIPGGYTASFATVVGGALFGVGAFVNRACAFGSIARLGSGDWAYLATPAGFYIGALVAQSLPAPASLAGPSIMTVAPAWVAIVVGALLLARLFSHGWRIARGGRSSLSDRWSPHVATTVIGISFLVALVTAGPWTYTTLLGDLAQGTTLRMAWKLVLTIALLGGAMVGGWTDGRLKFVVPGLMRLVRCFAGGVIMGVGSRLIPGGNTGLVLIGMPLLRPYAWLAFASMVATIYVAVRLARA